MTQHTPGPWTAVERSSFGSGKMRIQHWYDGGATDVAQVLKPATMIHATYGANVRLIAAAPEMLAFIVDVAKTTVGHGCVPLDGFGDNPGLIKAARALLARIDGKE